jgi:hypothetical protein
MINEFPQIWLVDFEFHGEPERTWPLCMVAKEYHSGREIKMWREELLACTETPFDVGPNSLVVAFVASAEIGCFISLEWQLPVNVLDLSAEHRLVTNGHKFAFIDPGFVTDEHGKKKRKKPPSVKSLLGSLMVHCKCQIDHGKFEEKDAMRDLILSKREFTTDERKAIPDYCASDVYGLEFLLPALDSRISPERALLRGRFMVRLAEVEQNGVELDGPLTRRLLKHWDELVDRMTEQVNGSYGIYERGRDGKWHFRQNNFLSSRTTLSSQSEPCALSSAWNRRPDRTMAPRSNPSAAPSSQKNFRLHADIRAACSRSARAVSPPTARPMRSIHSRMERPSATSRLPVLMACVCRYSRIIRARAP